LKPWFLEQMYAATHNADVVYGYADMSNWPPDAPQLELINAPFDAVRLRETNWIPGGCTLIRTELFRKVGGYPVDMPDVTHAGDWYLWHRLLDVGARFVCVPEVTWFYRHHPGQKEAHARA
jgi:GT2 family glycosyltransferase